MMVTMFVKSRAYKVEVHPHKDDDKIACLQIMDSSLSQITLHFNNLCEIEEFANTIIDQVMNVEG